MQAGQRLRSSVDNKEVMLFPLTSIYVSQGEGGSYSHSGTLSIDFLGWSNGTREYIAPIYAPCTCKCVAIIPGSDNGRVFESIDTVHIAGIIDRTSIVTFLIYHDNNPIANVGDRFNQGDLIGHTGTAGNVSGDHMHLNTAYGTYSGLESVPPEGKTQLVNSSHIYDTCYINDTTVVEGYNYKWKNYNGGFIPIIPKKSNHFRGAALNTTTLHTSTTLPSLRNKEDTHNEKI